ncbi:MAG: ATP-grasp domain-containing protein [Clostridiales bacterium]|nr:ATP-grasp domain-containing protein [Clostridiales bacterium]
MKKVLFITDECDLPKDYSIKSKNSEGNKASARNEMVNALNNLFDYVYTTYSISEANKYLVNNKDTYVVTTYYGIAEASSKSIIPAICKAENVNYLGADAYAQMICNDKYLSKSYIKKFGLNPIPGIIIYSPNNREELNEIQKLNYPLVVKPNFGGGSNGIAKCSVTYNFEQTITLIEELSNYQNMPILVEEYIEGYEISFIIIGNKNKIKYSGESKLLLDKKDYFTNEVFGLESKKINASQKAYVASNFIKGENKNKIFNLF